MMTQDPLEKIPLLAMETTYGACEAIVSGKVTGDLITVDRKAMVIFKKELGSKRNKVVYDSFNGVNRGSYNLEPNTDEMQKCFAVDNHTALRIAKVGLEIENKFGHPQDIELVVKEVLFHICLSFTDASLGNFGLCFCMGDVECR